MRSPTSYLLTIEVNNEGDILEISTRKLPYQDAHVRKNMFSTAIKNVENRETPILVREINPISMSIEAI